jgi:molybdopterin converting factor small subunit
MTLVAPVTVTVRLSGRLAESLGARRAVEIDEGATVDDLREAIAREAGIDPGHAGTFAVVASGSFLARSHTLADGDELDVLVPVAGG